MNKENELDIFRKVNGENKIINNSHVNCVVSNSIKAGNFNQGVAKAKFKEFIEKEGKKIEKWVNI